MNRDELGFAVFCIEGVSDMHCRSDGYLAEELVLELSENKPERGR